MTLRARGLALAALALTGGAASAAERESAIAFAGLEPGHAIAEFLPRSNDRAQSFCAAVGDAGRIYSVVLPDAPPREPACASMTTQVLTARNYHAPEMHSDSDDPGWVYEYWAQRSPAESYVSPAPLDVLWVAGRYAELRDLRYVHIAWLGALKPGATLIVEEKVRKKEAEKIERAIVAAGFEFVARGADGDRLLLKFRKPAG